MEERIDNKDSYDFKMLLFKYMFGLGRRIVIRIGWKSLEAWGES
tara:strand:- start:126 stop:257 length:132 start_codon:yes stop_codon:yes gene_type:complete